jgi:hypothetical protein
MRNIGGELARGGVARRIVPAGGVFFLFPMGGCRRELESSVTKILPSSQNTAILELLGNCEKYVPKDLKALSNF